MNERDLLEEVITALVSQYFRTISLNQPTHGLPEGGMVINDGNDFALKVPIGDYLSWNFIGHGTTKFRGYHQRSRRRSAATPTAVSTVPWSPTSGPTGLANVRGAV
jgi:hypothetical protein